MRTISLEEEARSIQRLVIWFGRRRSLRDPLAIVGEDRRLTPAQIHAIMWLGVEGVLTMGLMAHRLGVSEKTVTGIVDRLEESGLTVRERPTDDRRVIQVRLSPPGRRMFQRLQRAIIRRTTDVLSVLDPSDRKTLHHLITHLLSRLEAAETGVPARRRKESR